MFCNECGSQVPDGSKFCQQCGKGTIPNSAGGTSSGGAQAVQMSPVPQPTAVVAQKRSSATRSVLLLVLIGLVGWLIYGFASNSSPNRNSQSASIIPAIQQPVIQPVTIPLSEKAFTIGSGKYLYFKFTIPPQSSEVHMQGRFEASGGSGNDVEVVVVTEDAFTNWQNHHSVPTYYNSGRVTVGSVDARLPSTIGNPGEPATYYLIFNNAFSVFSNKAVSADITLHYNRTL
jgi:hypothetical protein